jgi:hypothetical protein
LKGRIKNLDYEVKPFLGKYYVTRKSSRMLSKEMQRSGKSQEFSKRGEFDKESLPDIFLKRERS